MSIELVGAVLFFVLAVFGLLFSLTKTAQIDRENFPNRGRFYAGLALWILCAMVVVFMSLPGYSQWFVAGTYPIVKVVFLLLFLSGFFLVTTTLIAFPLHLTYFRKDFSGRSDRIALLENIRQIASQPYPVTELFTLVLRELSSFLVLQKGAIFLVNPSRREMYLVAQIGLEKGDLARVERFPLGQDMISRAAGEQVPIVSGDLAAADAASRKLLLTGHDVSVSAAAVPLLSRDRSLGTLLVFSDKPYRFEQRDRLLLAAAADSIAGVIDANRLTRENQKLAQQLDYHTARWSNLSDGLQRLVKSESLYETLSALCRYLVERYGILAGRVVRSARGDLEEIAHFETTPEKVTQGESYRVAVLDAIRGKRMVVLNQEAKGRDANTYISRSTLLCPFPRWQAGDFALLVEAPGNGLPLNDPFMADVAGVVNLMSVAVAVSARKETDTFHQSAIQALLNILRIKHDAPQPVVFRRFLEEMAPILSTNSSALIFVSDQRNGYRVTDGHNVAADAAVGKTLLPGEGPVGKAAAAGEASEFVGRDQVEAGWRDLEPHNHDFFATLFGERGVPTYQLNIPVKILDEVTAVIALFGHASGAAPIRREKGLMLLAVHLLSIRLSMSHLDVKTFEGAPPGAWDRAGAVLNRINNDLATVIGRAELLGRQPDIPGPVRYTAEEILKAAEMAASSVKRLQEGVTPPAAPVGAVVDPIQALELFLQSRRVTGNLYMFDESRPVMLQRELPQAFPTLPGGDDLSPLLESLLKAFVALLEENDEVLLKSAERGGYFYFSLVRGSRDVQSRFDPAGHDYGDPDVMPRDLVTETMIRQMAQHRATVSFDRFGRRPTYISLRFPVPAQAASSTPIDMLPGLKILAIDDQQMILDLLGGISQSLGLHLTALRDPARGVELFKKERFDIVMVDLAMGRVSGWEIAREVKLLSRDTPVIMMTGWGIDISPEEAAAGGVDFTLAKPFRIEQLTDIINRARLKYISS